MGASITVLLIYCPIQLIWAQLVLIAAALPMAEVNPLIAPLIVEKVPQWDVNEDPI